jgi:hypothetical protein
VIYNKDEFIECFNRLILQQKKKKKNMHRIQLRVSCMNKTKEYVL